MSQTMSPHPLEGTGHGPVLSVVSPVHDEEAVLPAFVAAVQAELERLDPHHELVLVDDGSADATWTQIRELAAADPRVRGVRLSRGFGKEAALAAGLTEARGEAVIVMDADLQHPPAILGALVARWRDGADVVEAVKRTRTDQAWLRRVAARGFNRVFAGLTGVALTDATDFRLLSRRALDSLLSLPEHSSFFRGSSTWIGFEHARVDFDVARRPAGRSHWSTRSLVHLAVDGVTAFSARPLHLVSWAGVAFAAFALVLGTQTLWTWARGEAVEGFTTVILVLLVLGTFVLLGLGAIGAYLARIYDEVKARPRYVVAERTDTPS